MANRTEREFRLFFVVTNNHDVDLLRESGWMWYMWSMEYADKIDVEGFPAGAYIMLDNGYFTKFGKRINSNEPILLDEKIEHAERIIGKYLEVAERLKSVGIDNWFVFDFDFFSSQGEEAKYRKEYLERLINLFGEDKVFAVFHDEDVEWVSRIPKDYGVNKLAIGSNVKDYPPYDFRAWGYEWIHWFGRFDDYVLEAAVLGKVDSADISSWNAPTRFGALQVFEMGKFRGENVSLDAKTNPKEVLLRQIEEYKKALAYIDDMVNVEIEKLDKFYCDVCPIRDRCPYFEHGVECYIYREEGLTEISSYEEELYRQAKELKEKLRYEELKVRSMGMSASAMELRLRDMYVKILKELENYKMKKMLIEQEQKQQEEQMKRLAAELEELFGGE